MNQKIIITVDPRTSASQIEEIDEGLRQLLPASASFLISNLITGVHIIEDHDKEES